ncbi:hypothetical protein AB6A40_004484 [Gnathostoma spinigerum]|uniref:Uncharacterized protein n=1 Tax=Gnathostoma spinigerum TaxID=75299 RepID=A0ABD6ENB8_9BILA
MVMSDAGSPENYVTAYARLLPESDSSELQKVLEMKGLRRQEQTAIVQLYRIRIEGQSVPSGGQASGGSSALSSTLESIGDTSMRRLEKLVKKKL